MCYLGDLGMEVLHVLAKHLAKLAEHFFVPGVILQVHLGLDLLSGTIKRHKKRYVLQKMEQMEQRLFM